jgi:hypothetical protein
VVGYGVAVKFWRGKIWFVMAGSVMAVVVWSGLLRQH